MLDHHWQIFSLDDPWHLFRKYSWIGCRSKNVIGFKGISWLKSIVWFYPPDLVLLFCS